MYAHTSGARFSTHAEIRQHCQASLPVTLTNEVLEQLGYTQVAPTPPETIGPEYPQPTPASGKIEVTIYE